MKTPSRILAATLGVAGSLAALPAPARQQPPSSTAEMVAKLAELPDWLGELEAIVGPLERNLEVWEEAIGPLHRSRPEGPIEHLTVALSIDFYHQDPQREKDVALASWDLVFRSGREAALEALRGRFGAAQDLDFAVGQPRRFGDLYLTPLPGDRFQLAWYGEEPEWAVPPRDGAEERALEDHLIAFLRAGIRDQTVERFFPELADRPGHSTLQAIGPYTRTEITKPRAPRPAWVSIEIRGAPLSAARLVAALGLRRPGFIARDVHMSHAELCDLATGRQAVVDGYEINLTVDRALMKSAPSKRPAQLVWTVDDWRIQSLWLRRIDPR